MGTAQLVRGTFSGDLSHSLSVAESSENVGGSDNGKYSGNSAYDDELSVHSNINGSRGQSIEFKQNVEADSVWKQRIGNGFLWAGKKSLEIYMVHGLLLDVLKPEVKPTFPSIQGYGLIAGNFAITIILCVMVINLMSQSRMLKKLLGMK